MSVYKPSKQCKSWWYDFIFAGQRIRESAKTRSKKVAREAEKARRRGLEEGFNGIRRADRARLFSVAAQEWVALKRPHLAPRSVAIEEANLKHVLPSFGRALIVDIAPEDVARYQQARLTEGAAAKTVNLEVGTLRAVLRRNRLWANLQPDVKMLPVRDNVGRAITPDEEAALLAECAASRSRSLYPAVTVALNTAMRYSEIRLLRWKQIELEKHTLTVGDSKTEAGTGRTIPLNDRACIVLDMWASHFPNRQPHDFVFPYEKYGAAGQDDTFGFTAGMVVYDTDPTRPVGDWKEAWEHAKKRAGVSCRFHDLRHSACTRMLEAGKAFSVVATIMGWSPSTAVRMARRYGHIGSQALRDAVNVLGGYKGFESQAGKEEYQRQAANVKKGGNGLETDADSLKKSPKSPESERASIQ